MKNIPMLGAGTFRLKGQVAFDSVMMALEAGYRHIDTAQVYRNEKEVGDAIIASGINREDIYLTTKVWIDQFSKDKFARSVEESLEKLQTSYVDLLLIHWPLKNNEVPMEEYLMELKAVKDAGLAKQIGVSNFTNAQLAQAIRILGEGEIFTNQVEVHPYLQNNKVVEFCAKNNVVVTGYMPFAYGDVLKDGCIQEIADKHNASAAQVVLAWMRQRGHVTIPSSTKKKNVESNLASDKIELDTADMKRISTLDRGYRLANEDKLAPEWD
ncbi:2,5-didehydrogluconate reductase DkgB [Vibrio hannami]|uniref:2,5-didehydrogluconate reductase DkgB n=1 Tax=Vibrio hannami TaxID=2717094 RepID=UPI0024106C72|nr:2,5-didehydrogluconate reductase DkgB [Vibrio hannami]MDG3085352.1 2,5-didehydrogluconate reductase DkgB [Vibrio hannami]